MPDTPQRATLSVAIITFNEEENIGRTLASVKDIADEIIVVDSGSTDRTVEIAKGFGAKVFIEEWKGFAAQKNSALDKCTCDWILSLDADEEVTFELANVIRGIGMRGLRPPAKLKMLGAMAATAVVGGVSGIGFGVDMQQAGCDGYFIPRLNLFLGRPLKRGGFYPDSKLRLFRRGIGRFEERAVHESLAGPKNTASFHQPGWAIHLIHHQYSTLTSYIEHMNRYSSLGAEMVVEKRGRVGFSILNIVVRPIATFIYNYFFRLGFLDGKEGLLLHLYHSVYVSWKYAKAWELSRSKQK